MNTTHQPIKIRVKWTNVEPNVIKEHYGFSYELTAQDKLQLLSENPQLKQYFLDIWSLGIIRMKYPNDCAKYEPKLISATIFN